MAEIRSVRDWFADDELEVCPRCGDHSVIVTDTGAAICTECGLLGFRTIAAAGEPDKR